MVQPNSPFPSPWKKPQIALLSPCMGLHPHTQIYIYVHTAVHLCACIHVDIPGNLYMQRYINPETDPYIQTSLQIHVTESQP